MRFAINVETNAPAEMEDQLRDTLATIVETALELTPYESRVGTVRPVTVLLDADL